jgi:porin
MNIGLLATTIALALPLLAQSTSDAQPPAPRSLEDLNLVGAAVRMPRFDDTLLGADSSFRQALFRHGLAFRLNSIPRASFNLLDPPAPKPLQAYIGHRPTAIWGIHGILTSDLRQLGLRNAQFHVAFGYRGATWRPSGPPILSMTGLHLYKSWADQRFELKAGYHINDLEFIGMQIGGSLAAGAQGVYAVIPYLTGLSFFTLPAPTLNLKLRGPGNFYWKSGAQRSLDPDGAAATARRNPTGFRFRPHGTGLLQIHEAGFQRPASPSHRQLWLRTGLLYNHSLYRNLLTEAREKGNHSFYLLADLQAAPASSGPPTRGAYLGATFMAAPARFNAYYRYTEARLYWIGPFHNRPSDMASLVVSRLDHSPALLASLQRQGQPATAYSPTLTASYNLRISPGNYVTAAFTWVRHPAITPPLPTACIATITYSLFF